MLVHCNQTLAFGDGSSAASLALSLHELQTVADEIGAHVCVENMSYGVGADAAVLAAAVDEANALGSHRHEVRIAFDTATPTSISRANSPERPSSTGSVPPVRASASCTFTATAAGTDGSTTTT